MLLDEGLPIKYIKLVCNFSDYVFKVCQHAMERSILGVRRIDRTRNTTLRYKIRIMNVGIKPKIVGKNWNKVGLDGTCLPHAE